MFHFKTEATNYSWDQEVRQEDFFSNKETGSSQILFDPCLCFLVSCSFHFRFLGNCMFLSRLAVQMHTTISVISRIHDTWFRGHAWHDLLVEPFLAVSSCIESVLNSHISDGDALN